MQYLIICGGVSVGEYDLVKDELKKAGVRKIFWRVKQKPGKPLFYGKKGETHIFGLPGNPAAVFVTAFEYVIPAIKKMMECFDAWPRTEFAKLSAPINWRRDRTEFIRAFNGDGSVRPFKENESHMLKELAKANCLIVAEKTGKYKKGEKVEIHLL